MRNEYFVVGNEVFIKLFNRTKIAWTIIDIDSFDLVNKFRGWWVLKITPSGNRYAIWNRPQLRGRLYMHRIITKLKGEDKIEPDHIDGNGLNNRLANLRVVTRSINNFNKLPQSNNTSGTSGVIFRKDTRRWQARIKLNGKTTYLGCFIKKSEAIEARRKAEDAYLP